MAKFGNNEQIKRGNMTLSITRQLMVLREIEKAGESGITLDELKTRINGVSITNGKVYDPECCAENLLLLFRDRELCIGVTPNCELAFRITDKGIAEIEFLSHTLRTQLDGIQQW